MTNRDHFGRLRVAAVQRIKERDYWLQRLAGELMRSGFPYDHTPTDQATKSYETVDFCLGEELAARLLKLSADSDIRLHMILTAGLTILLHKYSGCENKDILVGSPILKQEVNGDLINTVLILRNQIGENITFKELLQQVRQTIIEADKNRNYPIEVLIDQFNIPEAEDVPLFDAAILLENIHDKKYLDHVNPNMIFSFSRTGSRISGQVQYNFYLFHRTTIERIVGHFENLMQAALTDVDRRAAELDMLSQAEKEQLLFHFNDTGADYPTDRTIHELFEEQSLRTPGSIAVIGANPYGQPGNGRPNAAGVHESPPVHRSLTYKELNEEANHLTRLLIRKGLKPGDIAAIMVERSLHMVIGILAILKAGAAYLPINPQNPAARTRYMLRDSSAGLLLTTSSMNEEVEKLRSPEVGIIFIEALSIREAQDNAGAPKIPGDTPQRVLRQAATGVGEEQCGSEGSSPAYVIFTSGSTGIPKGVPITHANFCPLIHWGYRHLGIGPADRVIQNLSYYFDWSVWEIFITLTSGAALYIISDEILLNPAAEVDFILAEEITVLHITPTQYQYLIKTGKKLTPLKYLFIGAEKLTYDLVTRSIDSVDEHCRLFNMYGPTEATIISAVLEIDRTKVDEYRYLSSVPIGETVANTSLLVLDRCMKLCPVGLPGELYIAGDGLSAGYMNDLEKSRKSFIKNGFKAGGIKGDYLYKTGDRCRWLPDGTVEFLGRLDFQVKIRGYRLEPGEIENRLLNHEAVKEAHVMVREYNNGEKYLCAYLVVDSEDAVKSDTQDQGCQRRPPASLFRDFLSAQLPDYMVPAHFVLLDRLPLNPNGKIDRKALPEPGDVSADVKFEPPQNIIEKKLAALWAEVLGKEKDNISIDSEFFELGGQSLKAAQLVAGIHKEFNVNLAFTEIFTNPTIRELSAVIKEAAKDQFLSIEPVEKREYYILSSAQKRLYLLQQFDIQGIGYNIPSVFMLEGDLDKNRLEDTFCRLIERHESFRTSFHMMNEQPVQRIHRPGDIEFKIAFCEIGSGQQSSGKITGISQEMAPSIKHFIRPFDLSCAPLLRVGLIHMLPFNHPSQEGNRGRDSNNRYILMLDMHHIISDGTSMGVLAREFMTLYGGGELPCLEIRYRDFSGWQISETVREIIKQQQEYWQEEFAGEIPVLNLPTDYSRPAVQSFAGSTLGFEIDEAAARVLKVYALEQGATLFMVLVAIYTIFLAKLSSQQDIVVGIPVAGRRHADLKSVIGMFVNTLVIRNEPTGEKTFKEFLREAKEKNLAALANQDYQYEDLLEHLKVNRDTGRNPLFDTMLVLQDLDIPELAIPGLQLKPVTYHHGIAKFDLLLTAVESDNYLSFIFEYCTKLFKKETIEKFIGYFKKVVSSVVENPAEKISGIEIISTEEKNKLLLDFNRTEAEYPKDKTVHRLFEDQVDRIPGHIAVIGMGNEAWYMGRIHLTYQELNEKSNHLARLLREEGISRDSVVGLLFKPCSLMMVGILGILKAGGAYLPIDPTIPASRIEYILKDAAVSVWLTHNETAGELDFTGKIIVLDQLLLSGGASSATYESQPKDLAYMIYTSGSTGRPKGTAVAHVQLVNFVYHMYNRYDGGIDFSDRCLSLTNIMFDVCLWELFLPLSFGAQLFLLPEEKRLDVFALAETILQEKITLIYLPAGLLKPVNAELKKEKSRLKLNKMLVGMEPIRDEVLEDYMRLNSQMRIINGYGPTETTICASSFNYSSHKPEGEIVPVGVPLANNQILLLDGAGFMVPQGIPGEICISGDGVSRGYVNNPELTAEKFTPPPYFEGKRTYKTGDLARLLPDGNIRFIGRRDHQLKIRGYRIEAGEIENRLLKHKDIKQALVLEKTGEKTGKYLCAYFISDRALETMQLKQYLAGDLPEYMIPSYFIQLEKIPLTANGKIDRKALPEPEIEPGQGVVPPREKTEERLAEIWAGVLEIGRDSIGIHSNFFELGGHSLKAAVIVSKINKELNTTLTLKEFFAARTIRGLAEYLEGAANTGYESIYPLEKKTHYDLSSAQNRLYILQQIDLNDISYNMPAVFQIHGKLDREKFENVIQGLINRHEALRTFFCEINDETVQKIGEHVDFRIEYDKINEESDIKSKVTDFVKPFDLSKAPLLRAELIELAKEKYFVLFDIHHIISDGSSLEVLIDEFARLYEGENLMPLRVQYKDYAAWQNRLLGGEKLKKQEIYWEQKLAGFVFTQLPINNFQRYNRLEGKQEPVVIDSSFCDRIQEFCTRHNITKFVFLITVFVVTLSRELDQSDITIGIPVSLRNHFDLEHLIGIFLNVVLINASIDENDTFLSHLSKSNKTISEALENQDYPYEMLDYKMREHGHLKEDGLFSILFNYFPQKTGDGRFTGDFEIRSYQTEEVSPKYDMTLYVYDTPGCIRMNLVYKANLYHEYSIRAVLDNLLNILQRVLEKDDIKLSELDFLRGADSDDFDREFEKYY